jgi:nucleoside-diphosphate-sugar epimerase
MEILFIGGTGNISTSVSRRLVADGASLYLLNRGKTRTTIAGARSIILDINDTQAVSDFMKDRRFDCVVNWIGFTKDDVKRDIALFGGRCAQYIFIGTASSYQKPPLHPVVTESTPLYNPYWEYSRNKILCEERLMRAYRDEGFPVTIVRPSLTYDTHFPIAIGGWGCYTLADRLLRGEKIIVHGDGTALWTVTHAEDFARGFVGLVGHPRVIGQAFHITSDELLTWNQIYATIAEALGVEADMVHIPSLFINDVAPEVGAGLLGDKAYSVIFDNTKIKTFIPDFKATIRFDQGIKKTLEWFDKNEARKVVDEGVNRTMDTIIERYLNSPATAQPR